jgi:hypothetical protein
MWYSFRYQSHILLGDCVSINMYEHTHLPSNILTNTEYSCLRACETKISCYACSSIVMKDPAQGLDLVSAIQESLEDASPCVSALSLIVLRNMCASGVLDLYKTWKVTYWASHYHLRAWHIMTNMLHYIAVFQLRTGQSLLLSYF